jgi:hypothetical protein
MAVGSPTKNRRRGTAGVQEHQIVRVVFQEQVDQQEAFVQPLLVHRADSVLMPGHSQGVGEGGRLGWRES